MLSQALCTWLRRIRDPHQRTRVRPQREQIRSELVMQFASDFLPLGILRRYGVLGEPTSLFDGLFQRCGEMVELAANRREFRGAIPASPACHNGPLQCSS